LSFVIKLSGLQGVSLILREESNPTGVKKIRPN
jgi:hypothetical protein